MFYQLNDTYASRSNNMWKDNALVFTEKKNACSILRRSLPALYSHLMGDKFNDTTCVLDAVRLQDAQFKDAQNVRPQFNDHVRAHV